MSSKYDDLESHFDDARRQSRTEVNSAHRPAVAAAAGARCEVFIHNTSDRLVFTNETCLCGCGNCYIHSGSLYLLLEPKFKTLVLNQSLMWT